MDPLVLDDAPWRAAVAAIDTGDLVALTALVDAHPGLVRDRLDTGTPHDRDAATQRGDAGGYFARPYLLWFVAENPVRHDRLPANIAAVARALVDAARRAGAPDDPAAWAAQLDGALGLVATGRVPREHGVQLALLDVLADAGADLDAALRGALPHRELDAARHLLARGARETVLSAAALGTPADVHRLAPAATTADRQAALMCAAVAGRADTTAALLAHAVDLDAHGADGFHAHATPLHQAVAHDSLATVRCLVEAGASLTVRDRLHDGTPLDWAVYLHHDAIAAYLRAR